MKWLQPLRGTPGSTILGMADHEVITVGNYVRLPDAELAQGILDNALIESFLLDENMGRMLGWNVVGGFKLQVNKNDAETALKLLSAPTSVPSEASVQRHCPNCGSEDIAAQESGGRAAYTGASPLTLLDRREESRECKACGFCW